MKILQKLKINKINNIKKLKINKIKINKNLNNTNYK